MEVFGPPRRGFARLGEPLRLGEGRLCLGEPVTVLTHVFMACLGSNFLILYINLNLSPATAPKT